MGRPERVGYAARDVLVGRDFEDPDGHVLEIATPGLWKNY